MNKLKWLSYRLLGWPRPKVYWKVIGHRIHILNPDFVVKVRRQ